MKYYAEIHQSKVVFVHKTPNDFPGVKFDTRSFRFAVNVTNIDPRPDRDWTYNFDTGEFTPPAPVILRTITRQAFWKRLTPTERVRIINSALDAVKRFIQDRKMEENVNLDDPQLVSDLNGAEAAGLLDGAGRAAEILA